MSNDDFTIKVSLDFNKKDIEGLKNDVKKAVNSGAKQSSPASIANTISKKAAEIQSAASSSIYKYGVNHLKTKAIIGDLSKAERAQSVSKILSEREKRESLKTGSQSNILSEREKRESLKTHYHQQKQESAVRMARAREADLNNRILKKNEKSKNNKMSELYRNVRSISFSSMSSASGITSLVSKMGPIGLALGATIAAGAGIGKVVSWAGNKTLQYAGASAGGGGYTSGDMAALMSGAVPGINRGVGKNMAQSFAENSLFLTKGYKARQASVLGRAVPSVALYDGGMSGIKNLFSIKSTDSEKDVYSKIFKDIRSFMSKGDPNAAISLGKSFGLSRQSVLAAKYIPDINKRISSSGASSTWKSFDKLTSSALKQTSAIDHLTGQMNKLAAVVTNTVDKMSKMNSNKKMNDMFPNPMTYDPLHIAPGNSAKGIK